MTNGNILKKSFFLALISFILCSCDLSKYAQAVAEDSYKLRISNRHFINDLQFIGAVKDKLLFQGEEKYKLVIDVWGNFLDKKEPKRSYFDFYKYDQKILEIKVSKALFDAVKTDDVVKKTPFSDSVIVHGKCYLFCTW